MWQENECEVYNIGFQIRNVCNYGKSYLLFYRKIKTPCYVMETSNFVLKFFIIINIYLVYMCLCGGRINFRYTYQIDI